MTAKELIDLTEQMKTLGVIDFVFDGNSVTFAPPPKSVVRHEPKAPDPSKAADDKQWQGMDMKTLLASA